MFLVTGTFGDKYVVNKDMTAKELADLFNLDLSGSIEFEYTAKRKVRDRLNNTDKKPRRLMPGPIITGNYNGAMVTIEHYAGKTTLAEGKIIYRRDRMIFREGTTTAAENIDKLVYFMLHPWNESSPIQGRSAAKYFYVRNRAEESKVKMGLYERISSVREEILAMAKDRSKMHLLRRKAKGLLIGRQRIQIATHASDSEIAVMLIEMMEKHKSEFLEAWDSPDTTIRGLIQTAIDRNIIVLRRVGENNAAYMGQNILCRYSAGADPLTALTNHLLNNESLIPEIKNQIDGISIKEKARAMAEVIEGTEQGEPDLSMINNMVDAAIGQGVITFFPESNTVEWTDGGDKRRPIVKNVNDVEGDPMNFREQIGATLLNNRSYRERIQKQIKGYSPTIKS